MVSSTDVYPASSQAPLLHPESGESAEDQVSIGVRPLAGTNVCHRFRLLQGDLEEGFAAADVVV